MKLVDTLSLVEHQSATGTLQAQSELLLNSQPTGIIIPGSVLEAAVEVSARRYLLFVTDGNVFEESLTLALCQLERGILEIIHIGLAYHSGQFNNLILCDEHIRFHFIDEVSWTLQVADMAQTTLPFIGDPVGVQRRPRFKKWITITHGS